MVGTFLLFLIAALALPCRGDDVCTLRELDEHRHDGHTVTTEGTVIDLLPDEVDVRYAVILLKDGPATLPVFCGTNLTVLVHPDARIRVTGTYNRLVSGFRRFSGPFIDLDGRPPTILVPAPADRLDVPPIDPTAYVTPRDLAAMDRRSVRGRVLATWGGTHLMVCVRGCTVNASLASGQTLPPCGAGIKIAGYPETNLFFLNLTKAIWKSDPDVPSLAETPTDKTATGILASKAINPRIDSTCHGKRIRLRGIVRSQPNAESPDRRLYLDSDGHRVPVDPGAFPAALSAGIPLGSEVEVTGCCLLECESWKTYDVFPQIRGFALILDSPDGLRLLSRPAWWTVGRLLCVIAALFLLALFFFVKNRIERAIARLKLLERTRLAVEIHDSLSQMLAGVACQVAASHEVVERDPVQAKDRLSTAELMLRSCRSELKNCLADLRNDTLNEPDFAKAVRKTLQPFASETDIRLRVGVRRASLSDTTAHALLSILRELTVNAIRHGTAATVRIAACEDAERLRFSVRDDGSGFDAARAPGPDAGHFGLCGVRDRLRRLNGTIEIRSTPGSGTRIRFTLPRKDVSK